MTSTPLPKPTAIFIIDIQKGVADDPEHEIPTAARIRKAGSKILETARQILDATHTTTTATPPLLIVFIQHEEPPEDGPLNRGSELWKLVFEPREGVAGEVLVQKMHDNVFTSNPNLASNLKSQGIKDIIALGIMSEYCVKESCKGALDAGFRVALLSGAHSTYSRETQSVAEIEREVEARFRDRDRDRGKGGGGAAVVVGWEEAVAAWEARGEVFIPTAGE